MHNLVFMGKGDIKTRRGKIWRGTFGNSRRRKPLKNKVQVNTSDETVDATVEAVVNETKEIGKKSKKRN